MIDDSLDGLENAELVTAIAGVFYDYRSRYFFLSR